MSTQRILITGASGLLGSQLIRECLQRNVQPICLVRESSDCFYIDSHGLEKRFADLRNQERLSAAFRGVDSVIHTAAIVDFRGDKLTMFTGVNSFGALFCYRAARSAGVRRFLQVSTVAAVGASPRNRNGLSAPLTESAEFNLGHLRIPYILSKYQAEQLLFQARLEGKTESDGKTQPELVIVNPSIMVAPSRHGADKSRIDKLMSRVILPVFPNRLNVVDIRDVAQAILVALERGQDGERYLLTGDNFSFAEALDMFSTFTGRAPRGLSLPSSWLRLSASLAAKMRRKSRGGKLRFYPDLIKMLDYDWVYDNSKARKQLAFNPRPVRQTLSDLYSGAFAELYQQNNSR